MAERYTRLFSLPENLYSKKDLSAMQSIDMAELRREKEVRIAAEQEQAEKEAVEAKNKEAEARARAKKAGRLAAIIVPVLTIVIAAAVITPGMVKKANAYKDALALMDNEQYEEAITSFTALDGYKDGAEQIQIAEGELHKLNVYNDALAFLEAREYQEAYDLFESLGEYKDAKKYLSRFQYNGDVLVSETKVEYDEKVYDKYYDYDGNLMVSETLVATGHGFSTFCTLLVTDASTLTAEHDYDIDGNITETRIYQEDGDKIETYTYKYDSNGYLVEETFIDTDAKVKSKRTYENNEKGSPTLCRCYQIGQEGIYATFYYEYDEQNQLIRSGNEFKSGSKEDTTYENRYDEENRLVWQKSVSSPGNHTWIHEYKYDDSNNVIVHRVTTNQNNISEYSYEYDAHGNKVKETYKHKDSSDSNLHDVSITTYTYGRVYTFQ